MLNKIDTEEWKYSLKWVTPEKTWSYVAPTLCHAKYMFEYNSDELKKKGFRLRSMSRRRMAGQNITSYIYHYESEGV